MRAFLKITGRGRSWAANHSDNHLPTNRQPPRLSGAESVGGLPIDSTAKIIIFAWVNDDRTLRSSGSRSDPYAVFQKMLQRGHPPDDWDALLLASQTSWGD